MVDIIECVSAGCPENRLFCAELLLYSHSMSWQDMDSSANIALLYNLMNF